MCFFLFFFLFVFFCFIFFFFQAEDGIRDLVRSRGLGDVYKRQGFIALFMVGAGLLTIVVLSVPSKVRYHLKLLVISLSLIHI